MTTANKPTWNPATARSAQFLTGGQISQQFSVRDMPGHNEMKLRKEGQGNSEEISKRDLIRELEEKEREARIKRSQNKLEQEIKEKEKELKNQNDGSLFQIKKLNDAALKADDDEDDIESDDDNDVDDDDEYKSDEEDEDELLMKELEKIKREREEERLKKEREEQEIEAKRKQDAIFKGNTLSIQPSNNATIKRRWDDDVVFRNQAKNEIKTTKKRFINDTIRSDFHKKFLAKFIK